MWPGSSYGRRTVNRPLAMALTGLLALGFNGTVSGSVGGQRPAEQVGDTRLCLSSGSISSRVVEDERTIRFETLGRRIYRNRLSGACPGLRQAANGFGTLAFEMHGDSLCRGDLLRVADPARGGTLQTAPACPLGAFERLPDRPRRR